MNSSTSAIGVVIRLKYGSPTESWLPCNASASSGNTVPSSTTNAKPANSRLLTRNADSRETGESIRPGDRRRSPRQKMSAMLVAATTPRNTSSHGPMSDTVNECTEFRTPLRVRKVARIVKQKVDRTRDRFQTRSIPRRSCTITECKNAVAVSHGSKAAFSTGSHAQNPPQPSTS